MKCHLISFLLVTWWSCGAIARTVEKEIYSIKSEVLDRDDVIYVAKPPCGPYTKVCKWGCVDDQGHGVAVHKDFVLHKKGKCLACGCRQLKWEKYTTCIDPHCVPVSSKCKKIVRPHNRCCAYCDDSKQRTTREPTKKFTFPPFTFFPPLPLKK